jgi:FRG domain
MNNIEEFGYWKYYSNNFDWSKNVGDQIEYHQHTIEVFKSAGLSDDEADQLWESGYVCIKGCNLIIDRYYGGFLNSPDMVSRFDSSQLRDLFDKPKRSADWIKSASSLDEVRRIVEETQSKSSKPIIFRGQRQNYFIDRKINNPNFTIEDLGEISILSSFWRKVCDKKKNLFPEFEALGLFEWSKIFYTACDLEEIEKRQQLAIDSGEWLYSMQDMADSDDQVLSGFGNHRLDLSMGHDYNLTITLATLLQHYGLLSTVIDLTSSLDVAIFFATHKYGCNNGLSSYDFVGTNKGNSVIYLIRQNEREMVTHENDRVLDRIPPERPQRQHCIVSGSSSLAVNLPAFFLEGIINLNFNLDESESPKKMKELFPNEDDDKFLAALRKGITYPNRVTYFC